MMRQIGVRAITYVIAKLLSAALGLAAVAVITRYYGLEAYSRFTIFFLASTTFSALLSGWLIQSYARKFVDPLATQVSSVGTALVFGLHLVAAPPLILVAGAQTAFVVITMSFSMFAYNFGKVHLQNVNKASQFLICDVGRSAAILGSTYYFSFFSHDPSIVAICFILGNFVFIAGAFYSAPVTVAWIANGWNQIVPWFKFGMPVAGWLGLSSGAFFIERIIAARYVSELELGNYAALFDLYSRMAAGMVLPAISAVYPELVKNFIKNKDGITKSFTSRRSLASLFLAAFLFAIFNVSTMGLIAKFSAIKPLLYFTLPQVGFLSAGAALWQLALIWHKPLELYSKTADMLLILACAIGVQLVIDVCLLATCGMQILPYSLFVSASAYILFVRWRVRSSPKY